MLAVIDAIPLPVPERRPWRRLGEIIQFDQGHVLYYLGHLPYGVYFITKGRVQLSNRRQRQIVGTGVALGLESCLKESPHRFTAVCLSPVTVRFVNKAKALQFISESKAQVHSVKIKNGK